MRSLRSSTNSAPDTCGGGMFEDLRASQSHFVPSVDVVSAVTVESKLLASANRAVPKANVGSIDEAATLWAGQHETMPATGSLGERGTPGEAQQPSEPSDSDEPGEPDGECGAASSLPLSSVGKIPPGDVSSSDDEGEFPGDPFFEREALDSWPAATSRTSMMVPAEGMQNPPPQVTQTPPKMRRSSAQEKERRESALARESSRGSFFEGGIGIEGEGGSMFPTRRRFTFSSRRSDVFRPSEAGPQDEGQSSSTMQQMVEERAPVRAAEATGCNRPEKDGLREGGLRG